MTSCVLLRCDSNADPSDSAVYAYADRDVNL